jgi:hypothetical protein
MARIHRPYSPTIVDEPLTRSVLARFPYRPSGNVPHFTLQCSIFSIHRPFGKIRGALGRSGCGFTWAIGDRGRDLNRSLGGVSESSRVNLLGWGGHSQTGRKPHRETRATDTKVTSAATRHERRIGARMHNCVNNVRYVRGMRTSGK